MMLWRSSLLALTMSAALIGGANLAAADGPGGQWPNIPWSWNGLYGGVHLGMAGRNDDLIGGVQIGRNWQSGKIVYGIEGDISFSENDNIDWMGTVRGRLGYLISPSILAYGTAGLGLVETNHGGSDSELVTGIGVEGKLTTTTTVRLEFLNFSDRDMDVIRAGFNFKF
jgi:outer membrane immunogenic protein